MFFRNTPTWHKDWKIAQKAFKQHDYSHAVHHLAAVLVEDQDNQQAIELLDRIISESQAPHELVPIGAKMWHGDGIMKAYIHAKCGEFDEAISLLAQIIAAIPDSSFLSWLADWMQSAPELTPEIGLHVLLRLNQKYGRPEKVLPPNDPAVPHLERIVSACPKLPDTHELAAHFTINYAMFVRRLGKFDEAIHILRARYDAHPDQSTGTVLATTYKVAGQFDLAVRLNREILALPQGSIDLNDDIRLATAEIALELTLLDEALENFEQVLKGQPDHPHAAPIRLYTNFLITDDQVWKSQLTGFAASHPGNPVVASVLEELNSKNIYSDTLKFEYEAVINIVLQVKLPAEANRKPATFEFEVSALEAPSAFLASKRHLEALGLDPIEFSVKVRKLQQPDPRVPLVEVDYCLWEYNGFNAVPTVPLPAEHVTQAVAELAKRPFNIRTWPYHARKIAAQIGPDTLDDLLRVMVHPPQSPANVDVWDWIHYVQIASALTLAYTGTENWHESRRRQALRSLAWGPLDWTVEAAIVALTQVARENSSARDDVLDILKTLTKNLPSHGLIPYQSALLACLMRIPALPREFAIDVYQAVKARQ